jgi:hypothetical protein
MLGQAGLVMLDAVHLDLLEGDVPRVEMLDSCKDDL